MKKKILPILISSVLFISACQNSVISTDNNQQTKNKPETVAVKTNNNSASSLIPQLVPLEFDSIPDTVKTDNSEQEKVKEYVKNNDIFAAIPYNSPDKYKTLFSGDGTPVFDLRRGFSGDGTPVFGIKSDNTATTQDGTYIWDRKQDQTILDYLQLNNIVEKTWGIADYATYSQLIDYNVSVSGAITNSKKVRLVKSVSFGLVKDNDNFKLYSISPLTISRIEPKSSVYQIRSITFSSDKNKVIVYGSGKLIPLPGISISKHVGNSKFKVFVEVVFSQLERPKDFAVVLGLQGKQYQMANYMGNIYVADVETDKISSTTGLAVELIDRDSLEKNDDYQGSTWILPITN